MQETANAKYSKSTRSIKWRLISLIQVELGTKSNPSIKKTAEKIISELNKTEEDREALQETMKKAVKVIRFTIDKDLADLIHDSSNQLLEQIEN